MQSRTSARWPDRGVCHERCQSAGRRRKHLAQHRSFLQRYGAQPEPTAPTGRLRRYSALQAQAVCLLEESSELCRTGGHDNARSDIPLDLRDVWEEGDDLEQEDCCGGDSAALIETRWCGEEREFRIPTNQQRT